MASLGHNDDDDGGDRPPFTFSAAQRDKVRAFYGRALSSFADLARMAPPNGLAIVMAAAEKIWGHSAVVVPGGIADGPLGGTLPSGEDTAAVALSASRAA